MARVKTKDTAPELALRRALYAVGVRGWRCHPKLVKGRPDLEFVGRHLAVFVDGAFWHGHPDHYKGQSGPFWDTKIARNRERDVRVNKHLKDEGWGVIRLWDFEVERDPIGSAEQVVAALERHDRDTARPRRGSVPAADASSFRS